MQRIRKCAERWTLGASAVNQAPITGESVPVEKAEDDPVFAGTINEAGVLEFRTTGGRDQTALARIIKTVQEAQSARAPTQRFVDKFVHVYTPIVCLLAVLVAVVPWLVFRQPFTAWLYKALVLLVIACPRRAGDFDIGDGGERPGRRRPPWHPDQGRRVPGRGPEPHNPGD